MAGRKVLDYKWGVLPAAAAVTSTPGSSSSSSLPNFQLPTSVTGVDIPNSPQGLQNLIKLHGAAAGTPGWLLSERSPRIHGYCFPSSAQTTRAKDDITHDDTGSAAGTWLRVLDFPCNATAMHLP